MSDPTEPKPTRPGEAPDDPGRTAQETPRPDAASESQPSRRDRTGMDHPVSDEDPSPDLTGAGDP